MVIILMKPESDIMCRHRGSSDIHFYVPYYEYWDFKIGGMVCSFVALLIIAVILYFPVIKPNIEQQKSVVAQVDKGNVDFTYGDVSEFSIHNNAYTLGQKYGGKIVRFTGRVGVISYSSSSTTNCDGEMSIYSSVLQNEWCADCVIHDKSKTDLEKEFKEGDLVTITGEVYHSSWVIELRNCKIEHAVNK